VLFSILLEEDLRWGVDNLFLTVVIDYGSTIPLRFEKIPLFFGDELDLHYKSFKYYIAKLINLL